MRFVWGVLVAAATALVFSATAAAQFPHVNSYEAGTIVPPWHGMYESKPGRMTVVPSPTNPAHNVMRVELRDDDDRAEDPWDKVTRQRAEAWDRKGPEDRARYSQWPDPEGSERWYGWRTYLAPGFPSLPKEQWSVLTQFQDVEVSGPPPFALLIDGSNFELHSRGNQVAGASGNPWQAPATPGMWHEFLFHVKWSPNPLVGFAELWHNGTKVIPEKKMATMDYEVAGVLYPSPVYVRQGLYRHVSIDVNQTLYHDTLRVGLTKEQVLP